MGTRQPTYLQHADFRIDDVASTKNRAPSPLCRQVLSSLIAAVIRDRCEHLGYTCEAEDYCGECGAEQLEDLLAELAGLVITATSGSGVVTRGCLLSSVSSRSEGGKTYWEFVFTPLAIASFHPDNPFSASNTAAALFFTSKYAPMLLQLASQMLERGAGKMYLSLATLRRVLGVEDEKYLNWNDFRRFVLDPAAHEITEVAHLDLTTSELRQSRKVIGIEVHCAAKEWLSHVSQQCFHSVSRNSLTGQGLH